MSPLLVVLCYGSAMVLSLLLLWYFGSSSILLHAAAIVLAFVIGLTPLPELWNQPVYTLGVGWVFLVLISWGLGGIVAKVVHFDQRFTLHHR